VAFGIGQARLRQRHPDCSSNAGRRLSFVA
jgi:hypothetical protein